jgi:hypothetical protein
MTLLHILSLAAFVVFPLLLIRICTMLANIKAALVRLTNVVTVLAALLAAKDAEIITLKARIAELEAITVDPAEIAEAEADLFAAVSTLEAVAGVPESALAA